MMHKSGRNDVASPGASVTQDITLADYIARKQELASSVQPTKKLTFDEYWRTYLGGEFDFLDGGFSIEEAAALWNAAQENVPSQAPGTGT